MEHSRIMGPLEEVAGTRQRSRRVAVAEDDEDMRTIVADALRRDGHDVITLRNGAELLIRIARQFRRLEPADPLDLLVSDLRMPVITGLEILRGVRNAHLRMPVILMTAFGDALTRREVESLDAVLLDKPLSLGALRSEVLRLLGTGH